MAIIYKSADLSHFPTPVALLTLTGINRISKITKYTGWQGKNGPTLTKLDKHNIKGGRKKLTPMLANLPLWHNFCSNFKTLCKSLKVFALSCNNRSKECFTRGKLVRIVVHFFLSPCISDPMWHLVVILCIKLNFCLFSL